MLNKLAKTEETTAIQPTLVCCECGGELLRVEWKREGFEWLYDGPTAVWGRPTGFRWTGYSTKHRCVVCNTVIERYHHEPGENHNNVG